MKEQPIDFTTYDDKQLQQLQIDLYAEFSRRNTVATASDQVDALISAYATATGREDGDAYTPATNAMDAYPLGSKVTVGGVTWESLIPANTTTPGDPNDGGRWWKNLSKTPVAGAWDGNSHAYVAGDTVTWDGRNYTVIQAHTSQPGWTPVVVPALWRDDGAVLKD